MASVNIGRYRSDAAGPEGGFAIVTAGKMVGTASAPTSQHLWGKRFRVRMGRLSGTTPSVRVALYAKVGSAPAQLLGYSGTISPSTQMTTWDTGAFYESDVAFSADGPSNASIPIPSGTIPILAVLATGADLGIGQYDSDGSLYDPAHYSRTGLSQPPPDPFGSASVSVQGGLTISLLCDVNEEPESPNFRSPSGTVDEIGTDLELAADFRDRNGLWGETNSGDDVGDYMTSFQVQVRRQSDGVSFWAPSKFTATAPQQASNHFAVDYAGTTLVRGTTYEWKCWAYDHFGAKGTDSSWLAFTPANQGFVDLNGNPQSTVQDNTPDFEFDWTHQSAESTNAVRLRLYQGSTLVQTTGVITDSTASGASGTITWAESGLGTPYPNGLDWGQTWKYDIQGRDTSGNWSDYSDRRQFKTDAAPSIPDGLAPSNGEIVTDYPLLTFQMTDIDDTVASGLVGKIRIKDDTGSVLDTVDATYNATSGLWEYQTSGTDLASFDTYRWDAYGYDGTLYSGATTVEASATKSSEETFVYADGPTAEITSPVDAGTITSSTPTVTWTSTDQNRYRLTFYETGTTTVAYQRGWVISGAQEWTVPAGYLHNNAVYDVELIVEDNTPLQGYAPIITVEGAFTGPPSATGFAAIPITVDDNDPWATAIRLQWDATSEPGGTFVGYYLYRDDIGLTGKPYMVFASPDQTSWVDPVPASGREYEYALRVVGQRDLDRVTSARVYSSATVTLQGVVLCDVNNPYTYRAVLDSVQSRTHNRIRDEQIFMVGAAEKPLTFRSPTKYWEIPAEYRIIPPSGPNKTAAIAQRLSALIDLEDQDPVMCYRDERGQVLFGRFKDFTYNQLKFYPEISFGIREENYTLGVVLDQEPEE